jgi:hypothetical protein
MLIHPTAALVRRKIMKQQRRISQFSDKVAALKIFIEKEV